MHLRTTLSSNSIIQTLERRYLYSTYNNSSTALSRQGSLASLIEVLPRRRFVSPRLATSHTTTAPRYTRNVCDSSRSKTLTTCSVAKQNSRPSIAIERQRTSRQQTRTMTTPSNPDEVLVIRELVPGVTTLSLPFARGGRIKFGGRATIVKLQDSLAVFSPVALTPTVKSHITTLGLPIRYLIAPDIEHHMSLSAWAAEYPSAHIIGPEGLPEKRAAQNRTDKAVSILDFYKVFTVKDKNSAEGITVDAAFDREFHYELVDAHVNKELVFVHKPSKTLITADLFFNMPATEQYSKSREAPTAGILSKLFAGLATAQGTAIWQKRLLWYVMSARDRQGWDKSVQRITSWDFENLVPCHGDSIVGDGKQVWEKVFSWHLGGGKK